MLLQFLQDRTFERVGGLRTMKADVCAVLVELPAPTDSPIRGAAKQVR